ncbi:MAG: hypothetical protein WC665_08800 [Sulfurimonas sp.]|jgi:hypothetical protein
MKIVKMSLVAALLIGSSAFAVENVQMSGDAQVMYNTTDAKGLTSNIIGGKKATDSGTLFDKDSSAADAGLNFNITADLAKNDLVTVSTGAGYTVLSTLGLENNFVSNVWGGSHTATAPTAANYGHAIGGAKVENANWLNEGWVAVTTGKSTAKLGRMELDTPLAFTEKWSIEKNTFEAAVLMNQDIQDTTLVAAYVGNGNGTETFGQNVNSNVATLGLATGSVANRNGEFATYGSNGAYAVGAVNNSFKPLTAQAWYYDVSQLTQAYWLQADVKCSLVEGVLIGAQYTGLTIDKGSVAGNTKDISSGAMAAMLGYEVKDMVTVKGAYSSVDTDFGAGFNTATATGTAQSKLYTESWWSYGFVTQADTTAMAINAVSPVQGLFDLGLYYTKANQTVKAGDRDLSEFALTAGKAFGPLETTLALINSKVAAADASNAVQAYLKLKF